MSNENAKQKMGVLIKASTPLEREPIDYQITVHLDNLNAHYGQERVKAFLKEFYFAAPKKAKRTKKVSNG